MYTTVRKTDKNKYPASCILSRQENAAYKRMPREVVSIRHTFMHQLDSADVRIQRKEPVQCVIETGRVQIIFYLNKYLAGKPCTTSEIIAAMEGSETIFSPDDRESINQFVESYMADKLGKAAPQTKEEAEPKAEEQTVYKIPVDAQGRMSDSKGLRLFPDAFTGLYLFRRDDKSPADITFDEELQRATYEKVMSLPAETQRDYAWNWIHHVLTEYTTPDGKHFNGICTSPVEGQSYRSGIRVLNEYKIDLSNIIFHKVADSGRNVFAVAFYEGGGIKLQLLKSGSNIEIDIMSPLSVLTPGRITQMP